MMAQSNKTPAEKRRGMIAGIHSEAKKQGIRDEDRKALQLRVVNKSSAADMTNAELFKVLAAIRGDGAKKGPKRAGKRRLIHGDQASKARALWLSLYHLGEVRDPAEAALANFARRHTKVDAAEWLKPDQWNRVIEHLKKWSTRIGVVWPAAGLREWYPGQNDKVAILDAQHIKLKALGLRGGPGYPAWAFPKTSNRPTAEGHDYIIEAQGAEIRAAQKSQDDQDTKPATEKGNEL